MDLNFRFRSKFLDIGVDPSFISMRKSLDSRGNLSLKSKDKIKRKFMNDFLDPKLKLSLKIMSKFMSMSWDSWVRLSLRIKNMCFGFKNGPKLQIYEQIFGLKSGSKL